MEMWIVLFKDNCFMPIRIKPDKKDYQQGTRFFKVKENTDLSILSVWYQSNFQLETYFKEI